jgi:hypothetical protein
VDVHQEHVKVVFGAPLLALPSAPSAAVETKGEMIPGTIPEFVQSFLAVTCLSGARTSFPEVSSRLIIIDGDGVPRHLEEFIAWSAGVRNNGSGITRECSLPKNNALMIFVFNDAQIDLRILYYLGKSREVPTGHSPGPLATSPIQVTSFFLWIWGITEKIKSAPIGSGPTLYNFRGEAPPKRKLTPQHHAP